MKKDKKSNKGPATYTNTPMFDKDNYKLMLLGVLAITVGLILMAGGRSSDSNVFDEKAIYSFTRITLAPILIVGGLVIEVFAIMRRSKDKTEA